MSIPQVARVGPVQSQEPGAKSSRWVSQVGVGAQGPSSTALAERQQRAGSEVKETEPELAAIQDADTTEAEYAMPLYWPHKEILNCIVSLGRMLLGFNCILQKAY